MLSLFLLFSHCVAEELKFLLISTPSRAKVVYVRLADDGDNHSTKLETLIDSGLNEPQGLAVDNSRNLLYVADPDAKMIYSYRLIFHFGALLQDGTRTVAVQNVEARWVAVDGLGNLFYTDEIKNTINQVPAEKLFLGETTSKVLYSGKEMSSVSGPGGVATDNFFVFWTNKIDGSTVGSLIRAEEHPPEGGTALSQGGAKAVARNEAKVYAVCLSQTNAFFTSESSKVYGVKKVGGPATLINDQFVKPRGCAWDGGGSIFVADRQQNAVYSFAGNMRFLTSAHRSKVVDCDDAFGLAVVSSNSAAVHSACYLLSLLAAVFI